MRRFSTAEKKLHNAGGAEYVMLIIGGIAVISLLLVSSSGFLNNQSNNSGGQQAIPQSVPVDIAQQNLQLRSIPFATVTSISNPPSNLGSPNSSPPDDSSPPPGSCDADSTNPAGSCKCYDFPINCGTQQCGSPDDSSTDTDYSGDVGANCQAYLQGDCQGSSDTSLHCLDKPVIYLYPTVDTTVSVKLTIPGIITKSIPKYPSGSGWQNVEVAPGGVLTYQGKTYHELFYESAVETNITPTEGIIIPTSQLQTKLTEITGKLGLKFNEQQEFLNYWLPKLTQLNSPYILFSVLTPEQKDGVDLVDITPIPDTRIEFIAYFKPLSTPIFVAPLKFPPAPKRVGFTEVEWGGTIGN